MERVKIGEFMDILCPHRSLIGITTDSKHPAVEFDIYNVTRNEYDQCQSGG